MEATEDKLGVEPAGVALKDGGAALLVVSLLGVAVEVEGGNVVRVERAQLIHDVVLPAEKLVRDFEVSSNLAETGVPSG